MGVTWGGAYATVSIEREHTDYRDRDGVGHALGETSTQTIVYSSRLGSAIVYSSTQTIVYSST